VQIDEIMKQAPVIPVIVIEQIEQAIPLAQALVAGGLPVLEVTLRSNVALSAIKAIADNVPDAIVGVGTVTSPQQFFLAADVGARFAVSPGLTETLSQASQDAGIPFLPGVFTPGEVIKAVEQGFSALKLFPAKQAGGIDMLKAMAGPLPDVRFCPTGGISASNFTEFLALPNVVCVGGSWVCPAELVQSGDWEQIEALAKDVRKALQAGQ
jgi:2-dehydro-3-deoxyphosphogluconate aldolase/(4S)-4-hydroxy-2-oxoglutarate aldolase